MQVKGCDDCPLLAISGDETSGWCRSCFHPSEHDRAIDGKETPDWCPLRAAPLTIALEKHGVRGSVQFSAVDPSLSCEVPDGRYWDFRARVVTHSAEDGERIKAILKDLLGCLVTGRSP